MSERESTDERQAFWTEMRRLWNDAGQPTQAKLADRLDCSKAMAHVIINGPRAVANWQLTEAMTRALGGDVEKVFRLWSAAKRSLGRWREVDAAEQQRIES